LSKTATWVFDGTIDYALALYQQLYTMHAHMNGMHLPLACLCLPSKSQQIYEDAFKFLSKEAESYSIVLHLTEILVDFEQAFINAARTVFPDVKMRVCKFHFTQSLLRRVRGRKVLREFYASKDSAKGMYNPLKFRFDVFLFFFFVGRWLLANLGLPNPTLVYVPDAFLELMKEQSKGEGFVEFSNCVLETNVESQGRGPL